MVSPTERIWGATSSGMVSVLARSAGRRLCEEGDKEASSAGPTLGSRGAGDGPEDLGPIRARGEWLVGSYILGRLAPSWHRRAKLELLPGLIPAQTLMPMKRGRRCLARTANQFGLVLGRSVGALPARGPPWGWGEAAVSPVPPSGLLCAHCSGDGIGLGSPLSLGVV